MIFSSSLTFDRLYSKLKYFLTKSFLLILLNSISFTSWIKNCSFLGFSLTKVFYCFFFFYFSFYFSFCFNFYFCASISFYLLNRCCSSGMTISKAGATGLEGALLVTTTTSSSSSSSIVGIILGATSFFSMALGCSGTTYIALLFFEGGLTLISFFGLF